MSIMLPPAPASTELAAEALADQLTERLQSTRQRVLVTRRLVCASVAVIAAVAAISTLALVDYLAELPFAVRAVGFACFGAAIALGEYSIFRRFIARLTLSKAAAMTEVRVAQFGQRLRTSLDYRQRQPAPAEASPGLLAAMHRQAAGLAQKVDWDEIVDGRPVVLAFSAAALTLTAWCVALILSSEYRIATARAMLLPAEYTHVGYTPHEQTARFGDSVELAVTIEGRPIRSAIVRYRPAGSADDAWTTIDLAEPEKQERRDDADGAGEAVALSGDFTAKIANLERDLDIEVVAGPRPLPLGHITVLQPLTVKGATAHVVPPKYSGRPDETFESLDLKVPEGSNIELRLELNRAAAEATLFPIAAPSEDKKDADEHGRAVSLAISENSLIGTLNDLRQSSSYTVSAQAADGMSLDPVPLRIRVRLDQPPEIKFLAPPEELVVTPTTEVAIIAEASDDLGLYKVGIQYRIDDGEPRTLWEGSGDGSTDPLRATSLLLLEDLHATYRNSVSYFAFAEDNYFGSRRRTTTELRFIDIRPYKIDYQVVDSQGGCCNGSSVSLEELIHMQRKNLGAAFAARQERSNVPEVAEKLRRGEATLLEKTREFAAGVQAAAGPVPTLDAAVQAMKQAVEQLSRQEIDEAVDAEQAALAALVQARENLRQLLKNSNSQQASNCRKFDRQFQQKLRMPEKKDSAEEKLAQARAKLEELAERERKWGQQAKQCCNSTGSSPSQSPSQSQPSPSQEASTPAPEELVKAQDELRSQLNALKQELAAQNEAGDAAQKQAEQADQAMRQGQQDLQARKAEEASRAADDSARKLEELADHLAAIAAHDFGERLDEAHRQAQEIARRQEELAGEIEASQPGSTDERSDLQREQESLATRVDMLGEVLDKLRGDAAGESSAVRRELDAALSNSPPEQIAGRMTQAAQDLESDRAAQAARDAAEARDRMNELAAALGAARGRFAQPQLEELLKLEEQLAQLIQQAQRAKEATSGQLAEAERKWQALAEKLARMARTDQRLADALDRLQRGGLRPNGGQMVAEGHYSWIELGDFHGAREVAKALQTKIQEEILAGAMLDSDQPIPAEYKPLVEEYYRTLSDDLR